MTRDHADGVLLVDKPEGMTSHDVVSIARRATGTRRIGHTGTLDPFATGLLVLLVGRVTRLLPYVEGEPKVYVADIAFGRETDTDDRTGSPTREAPYPEHDRVDGAIAALTGDVVQVPPSYSAKQVGGVRAYAAARRGEAMELAPVTVRVFGWEILDRTSESIRARIVCGGGTYIRALARDLGRLSGSAAHLAALRREASGGLRVKDAVAIDRLRAGDVTLLGSRAAVPSMPTRALDDAEVNAIVRGQPVRALDGDASRVAAIDASSKMLGILDRDGEWLRPRLVLADVA